MIKNKLFKNTYIVLISLLVLTSCCFTEKDTKQVVIFDETDPNNPDVNLRVITQGKSINLFLETGDFVTKFKKNFYVPSYHTPIVEAKWEKDFVKVIIDNDFGDNKKEYKVLFHRPFISMSSGLLSRPSVQSMIK